MERKRPRKAPLRRPHARDGLSEFREPQLDTDAGAVRARMDGPGPEWLGTVLAQVWQGRNRQLAARTLYQKAALPVRGLCGVLGTVFSSILASSVREATLLLSTANHLFWGPVPLIASMALYAETQNASPLSSMLTSGLESWKIWKSSSRHITLWSQHTSCL